MGGFTININKSNEIKYYISQPIHACGFALVGTGSIIQGFLIKSGVSDDNVTKFVSAMLIVQMLMMTLSSKAVENMKGMIRLSSLLPLLHIPLLGTMMYFCLGNGTPNAVFFSVLAAGILASVAYGLHGVLSYKLPYKIMNIKEYGRILGVSGVFLGLFSTLFSFVINYFTTSEKYDYFTVMIFFFAFGIAMFVLNAFVAGSYKEVSDNNVSTEKAEKEEKINIFRYKPFYILLVPNLMRGFHTGVWAVILVIGNTSGIVGGESGALLSALLQLALMIGCFIYSRIASKAEDGKLIFFSSLATAILAPLMLVGKNPAMFFAFYLVVSLFKNFIDYGVPTAITKIVDYRCIGQYSAWRMVLHTLGTALGGMAVPYMMSLFGAYGTLIIAGALQAGSGFVYFWYTNIYAKKHNIRVNE